MTPIAQRIAIATSRGWTTVINPINTSLVEGYQPNGGYLWGVPDYLNSREAMGEALSSLPDDAWSAYWDELCEITGAYKANDWGHVYIGPKLFLNATPAQQAEAYLKTLDLWTP